MKLTATNNFVFIKRDETKTEEGGLIIPGQSRKKPHQGKIITIGSLVRDKKIRVGLTAVFHDGVGFPIPFEGEEYLVLLGDEIIAVV